MILDPYIHLLNQPLSFWAATCDAENVPDVVHVNGLSPVESGNQITLFLSKRYSETFVANLELNPELALIGTNVQTFEGYQFKGHFRSLRPCTPEEEQMQLNFIDRFTTVIELMGFNRQWYYDSYFHQPSLAITFTVHDIFEQTPKKGTGLSMVNK